MKRYFEYEKMELAGLSEENVRQLVDLEIAYAGILPAIAPTKPELTEVNIEATEIAYEVCGLLFKSKEDADKVAQMEVLMTDYNSGTGYDYKYLKPHYNNGEVHVKKYYKESVLVELKNSIISNKNKSEEYKSAYKEYEEFTKKTSDISESVWDAYYLARKFSDEVKTALVMYDKYMVLADRDQIIASKFFFDAYKERQDIIDYLFPPEGVTNESNNS